MFPDAAGNAIYVITAYNPGGQVLGEAANQCAQARLADELGRENVVTWPAYGGDRAWLHVEPSVAVLGIDMAKALALGRAYRQEAIFALTPTALQVVECQGNRRVTNGWITETLQEERDRAGLCR
jgi:hypothetical protein